MSKIDLVYVFQYDKQRIKKAIKRAKCSIESLISQNTRIIFLNASKKDISKHLKDFSIDYHHIPYGEPGMDKSLLLNYSVKNFVKTPYFFTSDVDMVYPSNYISSMLKEAFSLQNMFKRDVRLIPNTISLQKEYYSSDYNDILKQNIDSYIGIAPGNGLINTRSFKSIQGYDESFKGYGPEDVNLNERISKINVMSYATHIIPYHLFHEAGPRREETNIINLKKWEIIKQTLEQYSLNDSPNKRKINVENFSSIQANDRHWGELK